MKTLFEHIEYAKGKPHHIRKRIAFTAAATGAGLVALVWLFGSLSSGVFALKGNSFAENASGVNESGSIVDTNSNSEGIAGVAAVLSSDQTPAHIEIVDTSILTSSGKQAEEKIIPF
ncbi:MAG: hypothetical protein NTU85_02115 [Candidatus Kaiserbacteria bacterium]|nr:hypothetical protein [Candidatus Kaiserbacteria bacterium]